jgi:threonine dehydratase
VDLGEVRAAAERVRGLAVRTPLLPLDVPSADAIHVKLENLQPTGSFKLRGAANSLAAADPARLEAGIGTASAGNMGRAVAWLAHRRGLACTVIVPDGAPQAKLEPMRQLGARIVEEPFERWWQAIADGAHPRINGLFLNAFASEHMLAGSGTIGLEILDDLAEVAAVVAPFGGGGLSCGIACAIHALRPDVPVYAAEVAGAAPLAAALDAGRPVSIEMQRSFVDGIGSSSVTDAMWPLASAVLAGSIVVTLDEVRAAVALLASRARVVAEGAAAVAVAAALSGRAGGRDVAAVVSGGNIDAPVLADALRAAG